MGKFTAHSLRVHAINAASATVGPIVIGALTSTGHPLNSETTADDSGGIYDEARSIISQMPEPTYTTKSVAAMLQILGLTGFCFSSDGTRAGIQLFGQVVADCATNPASTANLRYTIPKGLIIPTQLAVDRQGDATLAFMIHALTDGTNSPFSGTYASITLPTSLVSEKFGIGAMRVGDVLWREPRGWTLDFGIEIDEKLPAVGGVWPESTGVRKVRPRLTINSRDPTMLNDSGGVPLLGGTAIHDDTMLQLKKRQRGGSYYANDAEEHFAMTIDGMVLVNDPFSTSGDAVAEMASEMFATYDGTNAPVVFYFDQEYSPTAEAA
jgi:hypothetical protein